MLEKFIISKETGEVVAVWGDHSLTQAAIERETRVLHQMILSLQNENALQKTIIENQLDIIEKFTPPIKKKRKVKK